MKAIKNFLKRNQDDLFLTASIGFGVLLFVSVVTIAFSVIASMIICVSAFISMAAAFALMDIK